MNRRILYISAAHVCAFTLEKGKLAAAGEFSDGLEDRQRYAQFLAADINTPLYVVTDVVEEDFHPELIPHVAPRTRAALLERKLVQAYRGTPFRYAQVHGRETAGRKDDRAMFSALTNVDGLNYWLDPIFAAKAPLAGIYSVATLAPLLAARLPAGSGNVLLITWNKRAGLRQTFVQNGGYKFSRLIGLSEPDPTLFAEAVEREAKRTQQFLANQRLLARNEILEVHILVRPAEVALLQQHCTDAEQIHFYPADGVELLPGLPVDMAGDQAEWMFAGLFSKRPPANHYAPRERTHHYQLWQVRQIMTVSAIALGVLTVVGAIYATASGVSRSLAAAVVAKQAARMEEQYNTLAATFPKTPVPPEVMKAKVSAYDLLAKNWSLPTPLMIHISQAMTSVPNIQLGKYTWINTYDANETPADSAEAAPAAPGQVAAPDPAAAIVTEPTAAPFQVAVLEGEVQPFSGDYRAAFAAVQAVIDRLQTDPRIKVTPLAMPIDTRPEASVTGKLGDRGGLKALFKLRIVQSPTLPATVK